MGGCSEEAVNCAVHIAFANRLHFGSSVFSGHVRAIACDHVSPQIHCKHCKPHTDSGPWFRFFFLLWRQRNLLKKLCRLVKVCVKCSKWIIVNCEQYQGQQPPPNGCQTHRTNMHICTNGNTETRSSRSGVRNLQASQCQTHIFILRAKLMYVDTVLTNTNTNYHSTENFVFQIHMVPYGTVAAAAAAADDWWTTAVLTIL